MFAGPSQSILTAKVGDRAVLLTAGPEGWQQRLQPRTSTEAFLKILGLDLRSSPMTHVSRRHESQWPAAIWVHSRRLHRGSAPAGVFSWRPSASYRSHGPAIRY